MSISNKIHIGTSGWHYDHWKGSFYPVNMDHSDMLGFYSQIFSTVEINNTFYQIPEENTLLQWKVNVPHGFIFSVKASRYITHMKKLKDPASTVTRFLNNINLLGEHRGPILFQLPPNWNINRERLRSFLRFLPDGYKYTFEFRDESWFDIDICNILEEYNASFCIYEFAGTVSPFIITADFVYVRLHGPYVAYQGSYSTESLEEWAENITNWEKQGKEVFVYFDNDEKGYAPLNARELLSILDSEN